MFLAAKARASKIVGLELGLDLQRSYGCWTEMLKAEQNREDKLGLITVATPNNIAITKDPTAICIV